MIRKAFALLLLMSAAAPAAAAPPDGPATTFQGSDLFSLEVASDPQISPDGTKIAYVRRTGDVMSDRMRPSIWVVDTRTGEQRPLVAGTGSHSSPRWSPDGRRLAYVSTAEGGGPQLFVRWMDSGQSVRITGLPDSPSSLAWSPDGQRIAYSMFVPDDGMKLGSAPSPKPEGAQWAPSLEVITAIAYRSDDSGYAKPGYTQIFVVSADGGAPRQLTFGARNNDGPLSWSPDGQTILFSGNRNANWEREPFDTEVYALDVSSGGVRTLTDRRGPDEAPAMSPDGRLVAYVGYDDKRLSYQSNLLYVMNRDGSGRRVLTESLDRSVASPAWAADGRSVFVQYEDRGQVKVARVGLDGSIRTVTDAVAGSGLDRPYAGGSFTVARDGTLAITSGSPSRPADVAVVRAGTTRTLTHLNADLLGSKRLGEVRKIAVNSFDNRPIDAWLTLPPNYVAGQRVPLILEIHGGPVAAYGPYFSTDNQLYAASGYAVLSTNPRGSSSYGAEFANLIHHAYPGRDYDDLMAAVDAAVAQGFADPNKMFVTGGSGGGVLTTWIVGKTDRFKAAAAQKPVINWASEALTMDMTLFTSRYWFDKLPWEDPQGYWSRSPLSLVGDIHTPTLVVVGSEDYRTPVSEAEQLYAALQIEGVPTALVKVPGVGHGAIASRPSQSAAKAAAIMAWFRKWENGAAH